MNGFKDKQALSALTSHLTGIRDCLPAERLLAHSCEYCGAHEQCQVHHVRALKDLQVKGRRPKPQWMLLMAARQRKTMVVCKTCHEDITYGRPMRPHETSTGFMHVSGRSLLLTSGKDTGTLESRVRVIAASTVRGLVN